MNDIETPKKSILQFWWAWVLIIMTVLLVVGMVGSAGKPSQSAQVASTPTVKPTTAPEATSTLAPTPIPKYFDVPNLLNKTLDQIKVILGNPKDKEPTQQQIEFGAKQWSLTYIINDKELLVTYTTADKHIVDFFISTDDPKGFTKDKAHLLELGNVTEKSSSYRIEYVKALKDSSVYTGIKIIPQ